jgi:2,4-dienoyl-CoA reductase-like NADH-dependent reductase (Old Yellow Enzyme family)
MPAHGLFEPFAVRNVVIPSRIFLAPINTGFGWDNAPGQRLASFHRRRASSAVGLSYVGNVLVHRDLAPDGRTLVLDEDSPLNVYSNLADDIESCGSVPGIQLAGLLPDLNPQRKWRPSNRLQELDRLRRLVRTLSRQWLTDTVEQFIASAALAQRLGFRVVQLHAAHGYLLSLLLSSATNERKDDFAADGPWFTYLLSECRNRLSNALLAIRMNAMDGISDPSADLSAAIEKANRAVHAGADIVDLSAGMYTLDRRLIYPGQEHDGPIYRSYLDSFEAIGASVVTVCGRITDPGQAAHFPAFLTFALARAFIADPDCALKAANDKPESIVRCRCSNRCHYFSRNVQGLECGVNPRV